MGEKLVVGPGINRALRNDRTAFNIDNDSFPTLTNAYQWRGRVKRKRGTTLLNRLARGFFSTSTAFNSGPTTITLDVNGDGNILTGFSLETTASLIPLQITITDTVSLQVYTDLGNGTLSPSGQINYATGAIRIPTSANHAISVAFAYYPGLPVLGLEEVTLPNFQFPRTLAFDTTYAYEISTTTPYPIHDVSWYKNPAADGVNLPGYVPKTTWTPTSWNGQDYRQFWPANYQGAFWVTNGVEVPFTGTTIGMQFQKPSAATGTVDPTVVTFTIDNCPLVIGDFVFANEYTSAVETNADSLNFQTGYVTNVVTVGITSTVTVKFPNATIPKVAYTPGILQYLTTRVDRTKDCIRWYDGDPTNGANGGTFVRGSGWVNFCPPLSQAIYSIAGVRAAQYYLVGAKLIIPFKDRLLFLGPVIQTSTGSPIYLQDTIIYSQNGTTYYTASFTGNIFNPGTGAIQTGFEPILVPTNQTATPSSYWEDQTGFGGFITAGLAKPITTVGYNEDVLIIDIGYFKARVVYTGNDIVPFNIFVVNSELGDGATFSLVTLDEGVLTQGGKGFVISNQSSTTRIDLDIPDQVFQINLVNNGNERSTAQRDFINEWIYFTYPSNEFDYIYPTQTLLYNYRDNSWGIFNECYTSYGQFRPSSGLSWNTLTFSWQNWNSAWVAGDNTLEQPQVIAGNQQGFVVFRENEDTNEATSLYIQSFSGSTITSPNHCLNDGDYIVISGCIGTISSQVNGKIFSVSNSTTNTFQINPNISSGTYSGRGVIQRMYVPFIATKQFPIAWGMARKTRLGPQQYLLTKTPNGQIQLLIYLSTDDSIAYNNPIEISNNGLIYSTILYTCRESTNLGLTPANTNLQMLTQIASNGSSTNSQEQIWHRMNTSLIGDTVQVAFTLSDAQMRDINFNSQFDEIELHSFILDISPGPLLA